jgi:hypothetical protein
MLWHARKANWRSLSRPLSSMRFWTIFSITFSNSLPIVDKRLIGSQFWGNLWSLPVFCKVIIFASFQDIRKCESRMLCSVKCVKFTNPPHYLAHAIHNSFLNIHLKFSTTKETESTVGTSHIPSRTLSNHILLHIPTSARIYTALNNQSDSAPLCWPISTHSSRYKIHIKDSSRTEIFRSSVNFSQAFSDIQRASTLGPERPVFRVVGTTLHQGWLPQPSGGHAQLTGQLATSTHWWPYPTHWVTGAPATRRLSDVRAPGQAASQLPHCGQATPGNRHMWPGNFHMRLAHAPLHLYWLEQTVLFMTPQTLPSGLSNRTTYPTVSLNPLNLKIHVDVMKQPPNYLKSAVLTLLHL